MRNVTLIYGRIAEIEDNLILSRLDITLGSYTTMILVLMVIRVMTASYFT